jgi:hypothetical protein
MKIRVKFLTHLLLEPLPDGRNWRVESPFACATSCNWHFTVPTGFKTDLASVPRLFWNILPPFGKYTEAAVLHDWLYRTHLLTRAQADGLLLEAMVLCRVPRWQRALIYGAVRCFGWAAWSDEKRWNPRHPKPGKNDTGPLPTIGELVTSAPGPVRESNHAIPAETRKPFLLLPRGEGLDEGGLPLNHPVPEPSTCNPLSRHSEVTAEKSAILNPKS